MMKILNERDVRAILYAGGLMGAGGGGSLENGLIFLESTAKKRKIEVKMISVEDMADDEFAGVVAGLGSPLKFKERGANFIKEPVTAYNMLKQMGFYMGRKINSLLSVELGAGNSFSPMLVSMETGDPLIDADGCGRAVPALETALFAVNGIATGPNAMTNEKGDVILVYPSDLYDAEGIENISRSVCQSFGMIMGISGWMTSKQQIKDLLVPGAYTQALKVGTAILDAIDKKLDVAAEIGKVVKFRELWRGKLTRHEALSKGGFDFGRTHYEGIGDYAGRTFRVDYQNENLVAYADDKPILTVPDLICCLNLDSGIPMSNADVAEGQNVLVCAMPAHENWYRTSRGVDCWKPFFETVGYTGSNIRF